MRAEVLIEEDEEFPGKAVLEDSSFMFLTGQGLYFDILLTGISHFSL